MIVSIIEWQTIFWVDYSDRGATVVEITKKEYDDVNSGIAYMDGTSVVYIQVSQEDIENKQKEERKLELLAELKNIQDLSLQKRLEYTTVRDMLPEGNPIREMKLQKLSYEGDDLLLRFETAVQELVDTYGQGVLAYII